MKIIDQDLFLCGARRRHNRRRRRSSSSSSSSTPPPPACQRRPLSLATRRASAARRTRRVERRGGARGAVCDCHKRAHRLRSVAGIVVPRIAWNEGRGAQSRRPRANRPGPAHAQSTAAGAPPAGPPARCGRRPEGRTEGSPQDRRRRRRVAQRAKGPLWALWPSSPANGKCRVPHGGALGASHALSPSCSQQGAEQASAASPSDAPGTGSILAPRQPCAAPLRALHHRHAPRAHGPGPGAGLSLSLSLSLSPSPSTIGMPRAPNTRCGPRAAARRRRPPARRPGKGPTAPLLAELAKSAAACRTLRGHPGHTPASRWPWRVRGGASACPHRPDECWTSDAPCGPSRRLGTGGAPPRRRRRRRLLLAVPPGAHPRLQPRLAAPSATQPTPYPWDWGRAVPQARLRPLQGFQAPPPPRMAARPPSPAPGRTRRPRRRAEGGSANRLGPV